MTRKASPESGKKSTARRGQNQVELQNLRGKVDAIERSMAVIEFEMDGTIVTANQNFLNALGYTLDEIKGQHHSVFVDPEYKNSPEYGQFWAALNRGEHQTGEFKRIGKGGREVWIQASYTPVLDNDGKPVKVVKFAADITEQMIRNADYKGKIDGINSSQAVIEFNMDGTIIDANDNFLNTLGYTLGEIKGQHHSMFVEPEYKNSPEYSLFWQALNRGEPQTGEFRRLGKGGKEVWIQASYTPIRDQNGDMVKVVKFASDITQQKMDIAQQQFEMENITKSIAAPMFVVDSDLKIKMINDAALKAAGYTREEVVGKMNCADFAKTPLCGTSDCTIKNCMRSGDTINGETVMETRDGKKVPIVAACSALFDQDGKPYGGMEVIMDQTEQKETMAEVKRLITSASEGDLSQRADVGDSTGDYKALREGVNRLLDVVVTPLTELSEVLQRAADKDMTARINGDYKGQFAELKENTNMTLKALDDALAQVAEAVEQVASASNQISTGSQSLAQGASEQASSLQEISSSLEEMSSMTKQNADNADQAKLLATDARNASEKGTNAMTRMKEAVDKIKTSSDQTAKILKTIDEIAFQTNLLALNAAVEAARAGEAGKGFAVVAEEVRNLAQRSAEAAKNTANMIEESVNNANNGVNISEEVANALTEISTGATKVNDLVAEIAAASGEQAQGIGQVNTGVAELDKVTQQNAADAEESASASEELNGQSEELQAMIETFKISGNILRRPAQKVQLKQQKDDQHKMAQANKSKRSESKKQLKSDWKEKKPTAKKSSGDEDNEAAQGDTSTQSEDIIPLNEEEMAATF